MWNKIIILVSLLLVMSFVKQEVALAQEPLDFKDYKLDLVDYQLSNGLRVILAEDHSAPVVAVNILYRVGGANDPQNRSGFAHLFEHMMFEGSANIGNDQYFSLLEEVGASANAYTAIDKTVYYEVAPANELPRLLWMESDRMGSLGVTQEAFDTQRQVVIEEFNQRVANQPYGVSNRRLFTQPFQGYVPYERTVIGSITDLEAATREEAQAFFERYYKPNNATLVIVGDLDIEQTQVLVQAYFGDIPAGELIVPVTKQYPLPEDFPALRTDAVTGCQIGSEEVLIDNKVQLPRYAATVVGPPRDTADYYALSLLSNILGRGASSRFNQEIVQAGLAARATLNLNDYLGASILATSITPNAEGSVEATPALIQAQFAAVRAEGVTEAELARVKEQVKIGTINDFRNSVLRTAEWLQDAVLTFGDPDAIARELALYEAVTLNDIQRVADMYLCHKPWNSLTTLPAGDEILAPYPGLLVEPIETSGYVSDLGLAFIDLDDLESRLTKLPQGIVSRQTVPASLPVSESNFPPFELFELDNGLDVIFVEQHEVPKIRLQLFVRGSNPIVSADKQGLASLLADLLTKGTRIRTAAQIAETIEAVGGSVSAGAGLESISLSVNAPITETKLAFRLLAHLARFSNFPEAEFETAKNRRLTLMKQSEVNPNVLANRQFGQVAFGGHPYSYYTSSETLAEITRDDIFAHYRTYIKPNNALLVVVGDLSVEEGRAWAERAFRNWKPEAVADPGDYPEAVTGDTAKIYLVDRPEAQQATIQVGNLATDARDPNRYALTVANTVLGSGASSRLFTNLREDKGYTYGVYSRFARTNDTGSFRVITDVNQENTGDAIREILTELTKLRTEMVTETELTKAKGRLIGNFAIAIENPSNFANQLAMRYLTGVPLEELNTYLQRIADVTGEEVRQAAETYIESEQPVIVVVGNAQLVAPQLSNLSEVVIVKGDRQSLED